MKLKRHHMRVERRMLSHMNGGSRWLAICYKLIVDGKETPLCYQVSTDGRPHYNITGRMLWRSDDESAVLEFEGPDWDPKQAMAWIEKQMHRGEINGT